MPRRAVAPAALAGASSLVRPVQPEVHPITNRLRKMWKFAAICQFLFVFDEAFGMSGFETETLEADFESSETEVIPDLARRLLYSLTLDRNIDLTNWEHNLRCQYLLRDPDNNSFGTEEAPLSWGQLSLENKIAALHDLCEWQLQDPERFRKLVKSEEDITTWRVSPIGWDKDDNAYWLFDDNRIWIQRPEPEPTPPAKVKVPAKKGSKRARLEAAAAKRAAKASETAAADAATSTPSSPAKRNRASLGGSSDYRSTPSRPPPRRGTRTSARFAPPEDVAMDPSTNNANLDDSSSDLSDPPDDLTLEHDSSPAAEANGDGGAKPKHESESPAPNDNEPMEEQAQQHMEHETEREAEEEGWVEFETIVDWQEFAKRFAKSKDPNEKNLYQFINDEILDTVMTAIDEADKQKALEQAMANRKRSSRIALKESEREERERDREARARMEEKMANIRREEELKRRREEEDMQAHYARENRIKEREERLRARELELENKAIREEEERERREKEREDRIRRREEIIANGGIPPPSKDSTPVPDEVSADAINGHAGEMDGEEEEEEEEEEDWELDCEVCGKAAINPPNEDNEIVCCEQCGVWQHVKCWNKFDKHVLGRKKNRDWASIDFFCSKCRPPADGVPRPVPGMPYRREKPSPSANSAGRSSVDPESPSRHSGAAAAAPLGVSSRPKIKLTLGPKEAGKPADASTGSQQSQEQPRLLPAVVVPSQGQVPTRPPQPAETGTLTSSGASSAGILASAPVSLPPPSSHPKPVVAGTTQQIQAGTIGQPPLAAQANGDHRTVVGASVSTNDNIVPAKSSSDGSTGLGLGRPSTVSPSTGDSSRSPQTGSAGLGNGTPGAAQSRSPSYGSALGSPGLRRPSQVSGSFPLRHTPAKSPLSRPYDATTSNGDAHAPRAVSPSENRGSGPLASLSAAAQTMQQIPPARLPPPSSATSVAGPAPSTLGSVAGSVFSQATAVDATSVSDASTATPSEAAAAFRTLDNGMSELPQLFTDPTHRNAATAPLRKPTTSEKPVELANAHIPSPEPKPSSTDQTREA
ncbi:hypothetical protein BCV70DRAFT_210769 [Testicularia cyperi]|uniref:Zinc finger PHD-type domain-containing protein n=1 Tax=Testicularia cyperi TaxID=1882483 RepID=A0A317XT94_9BASI|nr:hypothetical protein BCV70DRAFT_210769 [Testicularia cyperi]